MTDCIFCKIISGDIPTEKFYEDDTTLAFVDIRPVTRGHALVIPKKHSANILEADDETMTDLILKVKKIAQAVVKAVGASGFTISSNTGEASGQTVFHLHWHILPRFSNDGLKPWAHHDVEPKTRAELAELIKKNL